MRRLASLWGTRPPTSWLDFSFVGGRGRLGDDVWWRRVGGEVFFLRACAVVLEEEVFLVRGRHDEEGTTTGTM